MSDWDQEENAALLIRWQFAETDIMEYHIYVKSNTMETYDYLGKEPMDSRHFFLWNATNPFLNPLYQNGPQDGESYSFLVYGLTWNGDPLFHGPIANAAPVQFVIGSEPEATPTAVATDTPEESPTPTWTPTAVVTPEDTPIPTMTPTATPTYPVVEVAPGTVIVTDDPYSSDDLSNAVDMDVDTQRSLMIRWNFPENDYKEYHVYVKTGLMFDYAYLGRQDQGHLSYFDWSENSPNADPVYQSGPQFGQSYEFLVYGLTISGVPFFRGPIANRGPVLFMDQSVMTPTPTIPGFEILPGQVVVTDDEWSTEDLSGKEDLDYPNEKALMLRWKLTENDYAEYHIYVQSNEMDQFEYMV